MLRAVGEYDGAGVYIRKLMDALLDLDRRNEYVLFYASPDQLGTYADRPNVLEVAERAPGKLAWDQVAVPRAAGAPDWTCCSITSLAFPLLAPCPTVVQQRGYGILELSGVLPRLGRSDECGLQPLEVFPSSAAARPGCSPTPTVSRLELEQLLEIPRSKMATVYAAADERFRPVTDPAVHQTGPASATRCRANRAS